MATRRRRRPLIEINLDRIDFISAYCDRWCERCAFTPRCSAYAVKVAKTMCDGDLRAALELAVGAPPPEDAAEAARRSAFLEELDNSEPTAAEMDAFTREVEAREERLDESPITTSTAKLMTLSHAWFEKHPDARTGNANPHFVEAAEVASWDAYLIGAKLHRALHGHDEFVHGNPLDDEPVQNDWNRSAKVALISIRRSVKAWRTIGPYVSRCLEIHPSGVRSERVGLDWVASVVEVVPQLGLFLVFIGLMAWVVLLGRKLF